MVFPPPENSAKKLRREVSIHEAETEVAERYPVMLTEEQRKEIYEEIRRLHGMIDSLKKHMEFAFPDADLGRHHAEHLSAKEDKEFWRSFRMKTALGMVWAAFVALLIVTFSKR